MKLNFGDIVFIKESTNLSEEFSKFVGHRCMVLYRHKTDVTICLFEDFEEFESPVCKIKAKLLELAPKQYVDFTVRVNYFYEPDMRSFTKMVKYSAKFTIDNQTFTLSPMDTVNEVLWQIKQLKKALIKLGKTFLDEEKNFHIK